MEELGRVELEEQGRSLWITFIVDEKPSELKVLSWHYGEGNLVITVPHAGTIGWDTTPAGDLLCQSGSRIATRKGTDQHPIVTYAKDAATDTIASAIAHRLAGETFRPHIIECHMHRSKVECNRTVEEIAVDRAGQEAELILNTYNSWIQQALGMCKANHDDAPGVLLVDLHGHGHPHDLIELGYRIRSEFLNQINDPEMKGACWRHLLTSRQQKEFTLRHLARRRVRAGQTPEDAAREVVIGDQSLAACLTRQLVKVEVLDGVRCVPSAERPSPGKLGYYIGGHTVREHSKLRGVDAVQVELPLSVRTTSDQRREAISQVVAEALLEFCNHHYKPQADSGRDEARRNKDMPVLDANSSDEEIWEAEDALPPPPPPPTPLSPPAPPPPPPPTGTPNIQGDGISHMSAMAKTRMQAELVAKVKLRQVATNDDSNELAVDSVDATPAPSPPAAVLDKIKNLEVKLEKDRFVPLPTAKVPAAASNSNDVHSAEVLPARRKLYESLFEEKTLSEKERLRREFLFGLPNRPHAAAAQANIPPVMNKPPLPPKAVTKAASPPPVVKVKEETTPNNNVEDEKKSKKNCCAIL